MLVLTRRTGESIIISNGIKITVVNIGPGRVKIGIEAPSNIRVDREEIHDRIQHEKTSDVLDAVTSSVSSQSDQATMVGASSDTGVLNSSEPKGTPLPVPMANTARLSKFRPPNKPR